MILTIIAIGSIMALGCVVILAFVAGAHDDD